MTTAVRIRRIKRWRTKNHSVDQNPAKNPTAIPNEAEGPAVVPNEAEGPTVVPKEAEGPAAVPNDVEGQTAVPLEKEQLQVGIRVKKEKDNKEIQIEAPPSGVIRVLISKQHNKKVQVKLLASTDAWKRDPKTRTLHKGLKQAQQEMERLRE